MRLDKRGFMSYSLALLYPVLATPVAYMIEAVLPRGNISLVYLTAVLITAVQTHTGPALICAVVSFMAYNFFFTEPEFTLVMTHSEDILTVSFFLLMAAVTGHLTARLREKLNTVKDREALNRLQYLFSEKLTRSINSEEVIESLYNALRSSVCMDVIILTPHGNGISINHGNAKPDQVDISAINLCAESGIPTGRHTEHVREALFYFYPLQMEGRAYIIIGMQYVDNGMSIPEKKKFSELLIQQASLAMARIKLSLELEQERVEKEQELLRSALLSSVSHDLKTPLSAMIGATTSLIELDKSLDSAQKRELLESILDESQRLDHYIQNLLDMTRLGHGELSLNRDWVSLEDILNVTMKRIKLLHDDNRIDIHTDQDLPLLSVHPALIEQALFNILDNAIKFSPEDSIVDVRAVFSSDENTIHIFVTDHGPGIPENEKEKVFDMFHTIRRGDRHAAGTGLGLTISRGIINAHGGDISVIDDDITTGTTFRINLPLTGQIKPSDSD